MLTAIDVPSKRRFDLIPITLKCIRENKSLRHLARRIGQDPRHAHFLIQNARILGFAISSGGEIQLTELGSEFLRSSPRMRGFLLCRALLESRVISAIMKSRGTLEEAASLSKEEISDFLINNAVVSLKKQTPMQRVTTDRRASTVRKWIMWLEMNLPCVPETAEQRNESVLQETLEL